MTTHRPRRFATCLLLALSALMGGCIESDKALLKGSGGAPPALNGIKFVNACEKVGSCLVYWVNPSVDGTAIGGQLIYRDGYLVAFEDLADGYHWIAQLSSVDRKSNSYALLREDRGTWTAYDFDAKRMNADYLKSLAASGGIEVKETKGLFGTSKEVRLINRAGLIRFMQAMAKLSNAELSTISAATVISAASSSEVQEFMRGIASSYSRVMLNNPSGAFERMPLTIGSGGCPKNLPPTIRCMRYNRAPTDPVPPMGPIEVLYFHRHECGHCERIKEAMAEWQLRLPDSVAFARTIAALPNETPSASLGSYDLNLVPALVINRKYKIELDTSDPDTVKTALELALRLAGELKR